MIALVWLTGCSCGNGTGTKGMTGAYSKAGKLSEEETALFANAESASALSRGTVLANGDSGELSEGIRYTAVPAYNTTEGREMFHPKGNGNGYVFDFDGFRVYVAGDTDLSDVPGMLKGMEVKVFESLR